MLEQLNSFYWTWWGHTYQRVKEMAPPTKQCFRNILRKEPCAKTSGYHKLRAAVNFVTTAHSQFLEQYLTNGWTSSCGVAFCARQKENVLNYLQNCTGKWSTYFGEFFLRYKLSRWYWCSFTADTKFFLTELTNGRYTRAHSSNSNPVLWATVKNHIQWPKTNDSKLQAHMTIKHSICSESMSCIHAEESGSVIWKAEICCCLHKNKKFVQFWKRLFQSRIYILFVWDP